MIFQSDIATLDTELSQLQTLLDTKRQQRSLFEELDVETNAAIEMVALLKTKIAAVSSDAIASLKIAVLQLFTDGGNNGGNQPTAPTPGPDDDSPELLCLNGLTGDCLTTGDKDDEQLPADNPVGDEWVLPSDAPLTGQTCAIDPDIYWETTPPDGSSWEFASPLTCGVWEDAPLLGQHCTISPTSNEKEDTPLIELVVHPENKALAYQRKHDGEIICTYIGFPTKAKAQSWLKFVEALSHTAQLRQAKRLEGFKWEIKAKGLSAKQIDRLAGEALDKTYRSEIGSAKPPTYKEEAPRLPVNPDEVEPGDIVTPLLTPGDSYEIIQVMPNGVLDCKSLRTGVQMGMRPTAVTRVQKGEKSLKQYAKILLKDCFHEGQTLPIRQASQGGIGYTVTLPSGDPHWFRADCVRIVDAPDEENALPTEPVDTELTLDQRVAAAQRLREESWAKNATISPTQWKELQALAKSGGLTQEQMGDIALIPYGYRRGGEILVSRFDEVKQKLEQALAADKGFITTNGNYRGLSRQVKQRWEKLGVDPQELIADMRSRRPAEPEWNADKYNPVLIAMGDDASDF